MAKKIEIDFSESNIPVLEKDPQAYLAKLPNKGKKLKLQTENSFFIQAGMYPLNRQMSLGYIKIEDNKVIINPISDPVECREQFLGKVIKAYSGNPFSKSTGYAPNNTVTIIHANNYIVNKCPVVIFGNSFGRTNIKKGLKIIHNLEKSAKCGKTEILEIEKTKHGARTAGRGFALVVPRAWASSVPMFSLYLLLVRLLSYSKPLVKENMVKTLEEYYKEYISRATGNDIQFIKKVMGADPKLPEALVDRWRYIAGSYKHKKDWVTAPGYWGIDTVIGIITKQKKGNIPSRNPLTGRVFSKAQKEAFLLKTIYDSTGGGVNYIVAARMMKIYRAVHLENKSTTKKVKKGS